MLERNTKWEIPEKIPDDCARKFEAYPNLIRQILFNRGVRTADEADAFLRANEPEYDPFLLKDIDQAIAIIHSAIQNKRRIIVFGDYDVDGVTASVILVQLLRKYKADVDVFIPNRFDEGYGLSIDALDSVLKMNPDLLITVDCGVRSVQEVALAIEKGIDVVITDHHQPADAIPQANAIVCPKQPQDQYPYKGLAGVGIAYKLAQGLLNEYPLPGVRADDWIDLVAVGTIADLADLDGENRILVRRGLRSLRLGQNKGILALANVSGTNITKIGSEDIGFRIGPRLNAAGRMDSADLAFRLLMAETTETAGEFALELDQNNRDRQKVTRDIQEKAEAMYDPIRNARFLFFWDKDFHEGVVGLAASRLVDKYYSPSIVGVLRDGVVRASCRSIAGFNITSALDACKQFLMQHGGHAMAAGLTIEVQDIEPFLDAFDAICAREFEGKYLAKAYSVEAEVTFQELHPENLSFYEVLEPLGQTNPSPLFVTRNVNIKKVRKIGHDGEHLRLDLADETMGFSAVAFRFGEYYEELRDAKKIDVLYAYETNTYNGSTSLQLRLVDFKIPEI